MAQINFNANNVEPSKSFELIEPGKYMMMFVDSELKDAKSTPGAQYLQLVAEILDGVHKGRKIWVRLNLFNPNPTAVEIAQRDLSAICRAVNVMDMSDSLELHNKPFVGKLKVRKGNSGYEDSNEIAGYEAAQGGQMQQQPPAAQQPPAQQEGQAMVNANPPPWNS